MIAPVVRRVEENAELLLPRHFVGTCRPAVKVGQEVNEIDVIGHCEVSAGQRLVKIAPLLGVPGKQVTKYLTRKVGDKIYEGEIIARRKAFLGLGKKDVKSPVDGQITFIDPMGNLMVKFLPKPTQLISAAIGKVVALEEDKIVISTVGSKINGFVSIGKNREGPLAVIASPKDFVLPASIKSEHQGKILVGGALLEKASLEKAITVGVRGIITGGINRRDFESLGGGREDVGVSLMITEGFGSLPMGKDIYDFLKKEEGRPTFLLSQENSLIITAEAPIKGKKVSDVPWKQIEIGDRVRIFREDSANELGTVKEFPGKQILNSGILTDVAEVIFENGERLLVPGSNLEIVQ